MSCRSLLVRAEPIRARAATRPPTRSSNRSSRWSATCWRVDDARRGHGVRDELRSLSGDASFLSDAHKRCAAEQRLADAIERAGREGRPVIVVAHSLGIARRVRLSHVATRLGRHPARGEHRIAARLIGASAFAHRRRLDRIVRAAVAACALGSTFAAPPIRSRCRCRSAATSSRRPPPDEPDAHEMVGYLRSSATAGAILGGWCAAFVGSAPAGCADVPR